MQQWGRYLCLTESVRCHLDQLPLQVLALDVVLANGTRRVFTNETDPFLMRVRLSMLFPNAF